MSAVRLLSPYASAECVRRLRDVVQPWWRGAMDNPCGRVGDRSATLRMPIGYRNSFQTILRLRLSDAGEGRTFLECRFGLNRFVFAFCMLWFAMALGFAVLPLLSALSVGGQSHSDLLFDFMFLLFGGAVVFVGRFLARNEKAELLLFLERTLEAQRL